MIYHEHISNGYFLQLCWITHGYPMLPDDLSTYLRGTVWHSAVQWSRTGREELQVPPENFQTYERAQKNIGFESTINIYQPSSTIIVLLCCFFFSVVSGQPTLETAKWHRSASVLGAGGNPRPADRAAAFWRATARVASGTSHVWRSVSSATGRKPGNPGCKWGKYHSWKYV